VDEILNLQGLHQTQTTPNVPRRGGERGGGAYSFSVAMMPQLIGPRLKISAFIWCLPASRPCSEIVSLLY